MDFLIIKLIIVALSVYLTDRSSLSEQDKRWARPASAAVGLLVAEGLERNYY